LISEQLGTSLAAHSPLERLQAVDLAFSLSVAPGQFNSVMHGVDVSVERMRPATQRLTPISASNSRVRVRQCDWSCDRRCV